ncbi:hypothetical protein WJ970_21770 [Achromobacter xylosoxidans]
MVRLPAVRAPRRRRPADRRRPGPAARSEDAFDLLERRCDALRRSTQPSELAVGAPASFLSNWLIPGWSVSRPRIPTSASACRPRRTPPC